MEEGTKEYMIEGLVALCGRYAAAERLVHERAKRIRDVRRKASSRYLAGLNSAAAETSALKDELREAIMSSPHLFERPRTRALEGVKVSFRKLPGALEIHDEARTIARIRARLPQREADLVTVRTTLNKAALKKLGAKDLAAIGYSIADVDDEVVIRTAKSDVDALVDALLAEYEEVGEERKAA